MLPGGKGERLVLVGNKKLIDTGACFNETVRKAMLGPCQNEAAHSLKGWLEYFQALIEELSVGNLGQTSDFLGSLFSVGFAALCAAAAAIAHECPRL